MEGTSRRRGKAIVQLEHYFLDEMGDIAVSRTMEGDRPLMGVAFVYVWGRVLYMRERRCLVSIHDGTVYCCSLHINFWVQGGGKYL